MRCDSCREALSARLDGEEPGVPDEVVDRHLVGCTACRAYRDGSLLVRRRFAVRPADAVPDLTGPILASARSGRASSSPSRWAQRPALARWRRDPESQWPRWALLVVGLIQLVIALPPMIAGRDADAPVHLARELGAWDLALAALLLVVLRPARAMGLVPLAAVLAAAMVGAAILDLVAGRTAMVAESQHLLELAGLGLLRVTAQRPWDSRPLLHWRRSRPTLVAG